MKATALAFAVALLVGGCVTTQPSAPDTVLAGALAIRRDDPVARSTVLLEIDWGDDRPSHCNATYIGPTTLLTAAHCCKSLPTTRYRALFADYWGQVDSTDRHVQIATVTSCEPNPQFGWKLTAEVDVKDFFGDVAVAHLAHPLPLPFRPVRRFPRYRTSPSIGSTVRFAFYAPWRYADLGMNLVTTTGRILRFYVEPGTFHVVLDKPGSQQSGNSGGGVFYADPDGETYLLGVVSGGSAGRFSLDTDVRYYESWIDNRLSAPALDGRVP